MKRFTTQDFWRAANSGDSDATTSAMLRQAGDDLLAAGSVDLSDVRGQRSLPLPARTRRPAPRRVVAAARHLQRVAQHLHAIAVPVVLDEPVLHSDSRAK